MKQEIIYLYYFHLSKPMKTISNNISNLHNKKCNVHTKS